jgi:hypothetical protein
MSAQTWEIIPIDLEETGLNVFEIFTASDGSIWGNVGWDYYEASPLRQTAPALSRFNETIRQFELAPGALELPISNEVGFEFLDKSILPGHGSAIWIMVDSVGVFEYDLSSQTTIKWADVPNEFDNAVVAPDGSLYFQQRPYTLDFEQREGGLYQLTPTTGEIRPVELPSVYWHTFSEMRFDVQGRLWLGAIGYRETDGTWHEMVPDLATLDKALRGGPSYNLPGIALISSDGLLWYARYVDSGPRVDGVAWYDPATGEGCMLTNLFDIPIEDQQGNLWMILDGVLYQRPLG